MKYVKQITLAVSIMAISAGNAVAEEYEFKAPNINAKLNAMVENKMDELVRQTYEDYRYVQAIEQVSVRQSLIPCASEDNGYDSNETRS